MVVAAIGVPGIVDVELAATTLGHPAQSVSLEPFEAALQELKSTVPTVVELSRQMSSSWDLVVEPSQLGSLKGLTGQGTRGFTGSSAVAGE